MPTKPRKMTALELDSLTALAAMHTVQAQRRAELAATKAKVDAKQKLWEDGCIRQMRTTKAGKALLKHVPKGAECKVRNGWGSDREVTINIEAPWGELTFNIKPGKEVQRLRTNYVVERDRLYALERSCENSRRKHELVSYALRSDTPAATKAKRAICPVLRPCLALAALDGRSGCHASSVACAHHTVWFLWPWRSSTGC